MLSFSDFLTEQEAVKTVRKGIQHLADMDSVKFVLWAQKVKNELGGVLENITVRGKFDGAGGRFGKTSSGQVFFESSKSGPQTVSGAFSAYTRDKGQPEEFVLRAIHYDTILEILKGADCTRVLPNDTKVVAEIFFNPMAEIKTDGLKFVTITYDKTRLGSLMTLVPYQVLVASTGETHPEEKSIIEDLLKTSNAEIKIHPADLRVKAPIDITAIIDAVSVLNAESLRILKSRKAADKESRALISALVQEVKDSLSDYLLAHPAIEGKFDLGPEIEGIVVHLDTDGAGAQPYKVTTPEFQDAHRKQKN